jgi:hypothetical protein
MYNRRMKCLSIRQPYADAILDGRKLAEFRTWSTSYTGPIAVHAALKIDRKSVLYDPQKTYKTGVVLGEVELYKIGVSLELTGLFHWYLRHPQPYKRSFLALGKCGLWEWSKPDLA